MSEFRSVGGATCLPSIQTPDESICSKRRRCQLCIVFIGCINPASYPRRSSSADLRASERACTARKRRDGWLLKAAPPRIQSRARPDPLPGCRRAHNALVRERACVFACTCKCAHAPSLAHTCTHIQPSAFTHMHKRSLLHQAFPICVLAEDACVSLYLSVCVCAHTRVSV